MTEKSVSQPLPYAAELNRVIDPELGIGLVDLGLIYNVENLPAGRLKVTMTLTSMTCPAGPQLIEGITAALKPLPDVTGVEVELVWDPPWDPGKMNPQVRAIIYGNFQHGQKF